MSEKGAVLISGTSSGIGHASALLLDKSGYRVFAGVRKEEDAKRLKTEGSRRLCPVILDITNQEQIEVILNLVMEKLGPEEGLSGLVNNAGICETGPVEFIGLERLRRQLEVNFIGHVALIQTFLPLIRKGRGRIINVTSANGLFALPLMGAYAASKFAMEGLSDSLRRELKGWRIPVCIIEPGTVDAPMWNRTVCEPQKLPNGQAEDKEGLYRELARAMIDMMNQGRRHAAQPEVIAKVVKKALEDPHPRARYKKGPGAKMAAFGTKIPEFITDWVIEKVLKKQLPTKIMGW